MRVYFGKRRFHGAGAVVTAIASGSGEPVVGFGAGGSTGGRGGRDADGVHGQQEQEAGSAAVPLPLL